MAIQEAVRFLIVCDECKEPQEYEDDEGGVMVFDSRKVALEVLVERGGSVEGEKLLCEDCA